MKALNHVALGLGSNLGNRLLALQRTIKTLGAELGNLQTSLVLETEAILPPEAPAEWNRPYLNCVVTGTTSLSPIHLLHTIKNIERSFGERIKEKWAPRTIDIDILTYNDEVISLDELTIPHRCILERSFVLQPLAQLMPFWRYPNPDSPAFGRVLASLATPENAFMNYFVIAPQVMGVINLSPDSFSSKGQYLLCEKAAENAYALAQAGASAIDMGAVATNATIQALISPQEEQERLFPLLKKLSLWREKPWISIDTPHEETAIKAIEAFDVDIINFAGKKLSQALVNAVKSHNKKIILTHHLTIPVTKNTVLASTTSIIDLLQEWGNDQIEAAERLGLAKEQLILDPGIGFGKTAQQNLLIIKEAARLKQSIKSALCFGISRKMKSISATPSNERDPQSTFLGSLVASQGIEWIRVHNVKMQMELLVASQAIALASYHEED